MFRTSIFRFWQLFLCYTVLLLGASAGLAATTTIRYQCALNDYEEWGLHLLPSGTWKVAIEKSKASAGNDRKVSGRLVAEGTAVMVVYR